MLPDFSKYTDGLVPAIIQDARTRNVLMLGYMNEAAFHRTVAEQRFVFFSRSRQELWLKGEVSGNYLYVQQISNDCDRDCLLIQALPAGPVCHTGADTCFNEMNKARFLDQLEAVIQQRKVSGQEGSYIHSLFEKGINKIAQKVGEEAVELVIEAKDNDLTRFRDEAADLLFHYLILLQTRDLRLQDIEQVLEKRQG
jgi:phosphoribosyl-ATP pyrophosphohydrolase/phosphoribosyl-AMP cyclohydrolase